MGMWDPPLTPDTGPWENLRFWQIHQEEILAFLALLGRTVFKIFRIKSCLFVIKKKKLLVVGIVCSLNSFHGIFHLKLCSQTKLVVAPETAVPWDRSSPVFSGRGLYPLLAFPGWSVSTSRRSHVFLPHRGPSVHGSYPPEAQRCPLCVLDAQGG